MKRLNECYKAAPISKSTGALKQTQQSVRKEVPTDRLLGPRFPAGQANGQRPNFWRVQPPAASESTVQCRVE